jgi:uncharacterized membrane protein YsdA (DUF1294 family)/ribosomal protein L40E
MHEETIWVKGLRALAYILLGTGTIGGFIGAWSTARTVDNWTGATEFAFLTFLLMLVVSFVGTFILVASIMVFLDIATDVAASRQIHYEMLVLMQKGSGNVASSVPSGNKPTLSSIAAKSTSPNDYWMCKKCDEKNPSTSRACKGCGEYK